MAARSKAEAQPMGLPDLERHLSRLLSQLKRDTDSGLEKTLGIVYNLFPSFTKTVESISASESTDEKEIKKALQVAARFLITVEAMITQATAQATEHARRTKRQSYPQVIRDRVSNLQAVLESRGLTMPNLEEAMETTLASMGSTAEHRAVETTANAEVLNRADELGLRSRLLGIFIALLFLFGADTEAKGKQAIDIDLMPAGIPALIQELQSFAAEMRAEIDLAAIDTQEALLEFLQVESFGELQQNLSIAFGALQGGQQNGPEGDAPAMGGGVDRDEQVGTQEAPAQPTVIVNQDSNIRSGKSTNNSIVGGAAAGDTFEFISRDGDWVQIRMDNGETGFIYHTLVTVETPVAPSTPAPEVAQLPLQLTNTSELMPNKSDLYNLEMIDFMGQLPETFIEQIPGISTLRVESAVRDIPTLSEMGVAAEAVRYFLDLEGIIEGFYGGTAHVEVAAVQTGEGQYKVVSFLKITEGFDIQLQSGETATVSEDSVFVRDIDGNAKLIMLSALLEDQDGTFTRPDLEILPIRVNNELLAVLQDSFPQAAAKIQQDGIVFAHLPPSGASSEVINLFSVFLSEDLTLSRVAAVDAPTGEIAAVLQQQMTELESSIGQPETVENNALEARTDQFVEDFMQIEGMPNQEIVTPFEQGSVSVHFSKEVQEAWQLGIIEEKYPRVMMYSFYRAAELNAGYRGSFDQFLQSVYAGEEITIPVVARSMDNPNEYQTIQVPVPSLSSLEGSFEEGTLNMSFADEGTQVTLTFSDMYDPAVLNLIAEADAQGFPPLYEFGNSGETRSMDVFYRELEGDYSIVIPTVLNRHLDYRRYQREYILSDGAFVLLTPTDTAREILENKNPINVNIIMIQNPQMSDPYVATQGIGALPTEDLVKDFVNNTLPADVESKIDNVYQPVNSQ